MVRNFKRFVPPINIPCFSTFIDNISYPIRIPQSLVKHFHEEVAIPPPLKERVFHFSKLSTSRLKAKANLEVGTDNISSLQELLSHLWRSVIYNKKLDPYEETSYLIFISARSRLQRLPEQYFGNAVKGWKHNYESKGGAGTGCGSNRKGNEQDDC
ncbi:hypothetical protein DITRI_Ditri18aG0089100 [Diplodiscus trichospermus]